MKNNPGPVITYAVVINFNLEIRSYLYGQEINVTVNERKTPFVSNNINDITHILKLMSDMRCTSDDNNHTYDILNHVSEILKSISTEFRDTNEHNLSFIIEQLTLHSHSKERYRYSLNTIVLSSLLRTISPHAYKFLRSSDSLILPHPKTLKTICNMFLTDPTVDEKQLFLAYARNQFKFLNEHERHMILLIDEIHIQP